MTFALLSYGAAALGYGLLGTLLALSRQSKGEGRWLLAAVAGTALWGALTVATLWLSPPGAVPVAAYSSDALRGLLWALCLLRAFPQAVSQSAKRLMSVSVAGLAFLAAVLPPLLGGMYGPIVPLGASVIGCLVIEQLFRNANEEQKRVLKPLLWTLAAIFGYDLFVFSDAVLVNAVDARLWAARGLFAALGAPVLLVAAKRHPEWVRTLFVSRQFVFYSTTLTSVGLYFIAMAVAGALIRREGGEWGGLVQFGFFVAALALLGFVLSSARLRAAGRMFITKHFYRNQYEYRDEWLRLIRTLSASDDELPMEQRSIKALADIVGSPGGQVWLERGAGRYEPFAAWAAEFPSREYAGNSALVRFLKEQGWVIDSAEHDRDPERYSHAFGDDPSELPPNSFIVPLFHQHELLGFARLVRPEEHRALNYEDHDLLKTAGRQVAAFLAHDFAMEQLTETRQFEAYNKLSAFVMHDLKNLLSQQALLVENAKKHSHRPEFVADVIGTVDHGVQRMRKLLRQLEQGVPAVQDQRVELNKLTLRAVSACADNGKTPCSFAERAVVWVRAHPDQLTSVITHVIQNAQEATRKGGQVAISVDEAPDGRALVEVRDDGEGMSEEFVRRRLFKPFETTKGSAGMGIGAYQARELVRGLGGELIVTSELGKGTLVRMFFPQARPAA